MVQKVMGDESLKKWAKIMCPHALLSQAQSHIAILTLVIKIIQLATELGKSSQHKLTHKEAWMNLKVKFDSVFVTKKNPYCYYG